MDMVRVCPSSTTGNPLHPDVFDRVPVTATPVFVLLNPGFRVFYKIFFVFSISVLLYLSLKLRFKSSKSDPFIRIWLLNFSHVTSPTLSLSLSDFLS